MCRLPPDLDSTPQVVGDRVNSCVSAIMKEIDTKCRDNIKKRTKATVRSDTGGWSPERQKDSSELRQNILLLEEYDY